MGIMQRYHNLFKQLPIEKLPSEEEKVTAAERARETTHWSWDVQENKRKDRGMLWFVVAGVAVIFLMIYSFRQDNLLLVFMILLIAAIYIIEHIKGDLHLTVKITDQGIWRGPFFYPYREFRDFYILYDPPLKNVYLDFGSITKPQLVLPLGDQNPVRVRETLALYLKEDLDKEYPGISEVLERRLKL